MLYWKNPVKTVNDLPMRENNNDDAVFVEERSQSYRWVGEKQVWELIPEITFTGILRS